MFSIISFTELNGVCPQTVRNRLHEKRLSLHVPASREEFSPRNKADRMKFVHIHR